MRFNTKELIANLTGKNKSFITRVANTQERKYGNVDIFSACLVKGHPNGLNNLVSMCFGDYWIEFTFNNQGKIIDTYGNGQGHKYHKSLQACAEELFQKCGG